MCCSGAESSSGISLGADFTGEQSRLEGMCSPVNAASRSAGVGLSVLPQGGIGRRVPPGFVSLNRWGSLHLGSSFFPFLHSTCSMFVPGLPHLPLLPYPLLKPPICRAFSMSFCVTVAAAPTGISKLCTLNRKVQMRTWSVTEIQEFDEFIHP